MKRECRQVGMMRDRWWTEVQVRQATPESLPLQSINQGLAHAQLKTSHWKEPKPCFPLNHDALFLVFFLFFPLIHFDFLNYTINKKQEKDNKNKKNKDKNDQMGG